MGSKDDFSSDLSEDEDEDGDGSDNSEKPRVSVFAAEGEFHSEFSVSADEEDLSDQGQKKIGTREVKSKSIFDDRDLLRNSATLRDCWRSLRCLKHRTG